MSVQRAGTAGVLFLLAMMAIPASAQSTHDEWLAVRTRKQARHHRLPGPATQSNAFTITVIKFFSDPSGNLVGVGEARNDTSFDLSYSRLNFTFFDANGVEIGREWTYLHGGINARIVGNNAYETLLVPGATGFFKIWTAIPAASMSSYTGSSSTDVLWQDTTSGAPSLWLMTGTAVLAPDSVSFPGATQSSWKIRAVADFNRDGYPDLVWQDQSTGSVFVWFMQSTTFKSVPLRYLDAASLGPGVVDDPNWTIVGSGDFNHDGWPDLIWQHQTDGRIAIWKMQRTTLLEGSLISPGQVTDLDWKIRAVGDMNGDDMPDLIWQHRTDGRVGVWLMNGTSMVAGIVIAQVPDTGWEIVGPR